MFQMRSNAMKTCAAGAMLFGGTLGIAQKAQAGLVWDTANANNYVQITFGYEDPIRTSGAASMNAVSAAFGSDSANITAATASGFSASLTYAVGGAEAVYLSVVRSFSVTGSADIQLWGNSPASDGIWRIYDLSQQGGDAYLTLDVLGGTSYSQTVSLGAGQYAVEMGTSPATEFGSSGSFGHFTIVPAPGAMALVGLAGLVGGRRRKA
jgi:uncharacterized protein (TIGR03382 family)